MKTRRFKNKEMIRKELENLELVYKTSITPFFPICQVGRNYSRKFSDIFSLDNEPQTLAVVITPDGVNWFFPRTLKPIAIEYIDKLISNKAIFNQILAKEKILSQELLKAIKTPVSDLVDKGRATTLGIERFNRILDLYFQYGYVTDVPGFLFQVYAVDYFKERIAKQLYQSDQAALATDEKLDLLLTSPGYTNYENFLRDLVRIKSQRSLAAAARRWNWLVHDYIGDIIDEKYLAAKIKQLSKKQINKDLRQARARIGAIKELEKLLPPRARREIDTVHSFLWIYNERKKLILNQVNIYLRHLFEARFPGLVFSRLRELYQRRPQDLEKIFSSQRPLSDYLRRKKFIYLIKSGRIDNGPDSYSALIKGAVLSPGKTLQGRSASPGVVRGRVNVVLNISQISKFVPGSILVAPFTNVNYLPIMGKASAILTETGGLTSHAAIVSRELKVPCIVGIPHLLANLYDGQEVEVDANEGLVKIIK